MHSCRDTRECNPPSGNPAIRKRKKHMKQGYFPFFLIFIVFRFLPNYHVNIFKTLLDYSFSIYILKKLGRDHQNIPFIQQPNPSKIPNTVSGIEAPLEILKANLYQLSKNWLLRTLNKGIYGKQKRGIFFNLFLQVSRSPISILVIILIYYVIRCEKPSITS